MQRENEKLEVKEGEEEEDTKTNQQPGGDHAEEPPEEDRESGRDAEEAQAACSNPDVLKAVTEAETQADVPDDVEQLRGPQRTENVGTFTATVKVVLVPEGHVMTVAFAIGLSIQELKCHLAAELRVPAEVLQVSLDGRVVEEQHSLMELGVQPNGSTQLEMSSTDPILHPLRPLHPPEQDNMPDVITVRVQTGEAMFQEVVVEIERPPQQKPFMGGYRHRLTGVVYHHAAVQTKPRRGPDRGVVVFSRNTQTVKLKSQDQQYPVSVSTQMTGIGCYVSCVNDKLVVPGNYITADEYLDTRLRAVICLQSYVRQWLARQKVAQLRWNRKQRLAWMDMQARRRREEKEKQLEDSHRRCMNPQKREDFNLLYQELEKWRCEEEQQINSSLRGAERKAALCTLLDQEVQIIANIERHHTVVKNNNYDKAVKNFLDKSVAPHQWQAADGRVMEMESQHTVRAAELRNLYVNISKSIFGREQRLSHLQTLKDTIKEHKCQLTSELIDLIDREVHMMAMGIEKAYLEGLRKRITTLLLYYIKTPEFNPRVAELLKVPQIPSQPKKNMFLCRSCDRCLQSSNFGLSTSVHVRGRCRDCAGLDNIARSRYDFSCYQNILRRLRADELQLNKEAKIPFLLQVEDVQYLVEVVWGSRSALLASSDLDSLVFVRWEHQVDWSPWNCILLSKEEVSVHREVTDVHKVYESTFIHRIKCKHMMARRHFSQVTVMAEYLDSKLSDALVSKPVSDGAEL